MPSPLERIVAALTAGELPAAGTYRDAFLELDGRMAEALETVRQIATLRSSLARQEAWSDVSRMLDRPAEDPAPVLELIRHVGPTLCATCGHRPARFWSDGTAYCGPCADAAGVRPHGKVGD
jgi:hypothetical protein